MKKRLLVLALLLAACRTTRPGGESPLAPLTGDAKQELSARRDEFPGERSIIRIRTMNGVQTQSARAQLQVGKTGDMLMTVFAPVINTPVIRLYAANGRITVVNDLDKTAWQGTASDLTGNLAFVGANPNALAFLILGLPPREATSVEYGPNGLQAARLQDAVVAYDPAVYPPQRVVIVRGMQRVEIDHLEDYVSSTPIEPLTIPEGYRCCVLP